MRRGSHFSGDKKGHLFIRLSLVAAEIMYYTVYFYCCCLFAFSRAPPEGYGGSQARGLMELYPLAYATAAAMPDPSHVCDLHHSSMQCWILTPLSRARDRTHNLMVRS